MKNPSIASGDKAVSESEIESNVTLVVGATRKATGAALRDLAKRSVLTEQNVKRVRRQVVATIAVHMRGQLAQTAENVVGSVKLISGAEVLELDPTDGNETIAEAKATFTGFLDEDFNDHDINVPSLPTGKIEVTVHEVVKDGTLVQIFGDMSDDLDCLCLTQPQIIQFVKKHRKWIRSEDCRTSFLFKAGNEFIVADVNVNDDWDLEACVRRLSCDSLAVVGGHHQIVVPQLAPAN